MCYTLSYVLKLCFLESISMLLVGSEPIERKQIMGTLLFDSFHISSIFKITPSANFTPIDSDMYRLAWGNTRSGHHDLNSLRKQYNAGTHQDTVS